jgi:hypothetical protein
VNRDEHEEPDQSTPRNGSPRPENAPCIEYLQRAIAGLLMKNETMRFELFTVRQRIERIDRTVFGADCHNIQKRLPPHLLSALRDLCLWFNGSEDRTPPQVTPDSLMNFRKHSQDRRIKD